MALSTTASYTDTDAIKIYTTKNNNEINGMEKQKNRFSFLDALDVVNPLQHIPVVSTIYRHVTGDDIKGLSRVAGGALFGGPIGAGVGGVNAIVAEQTGRDIGENLLAGLIGPGDVPGDPNPNPIMMAAADAVTDPSVSTADGQLAYVESVVDTDLADIEPAAGHDTVKTAKPITMADIFWDDLLDGPKTMAQAPEFLANMPVVGEEQKAAQAAAKAYQKAGYTFKDGPAGMSALY